MLARYPGNCVVCGGEITPRQTEIEFHPTLTGPKGGKKVCHTECMPKSNPYRDFGGDPHGIAPRARPYSEAKIRRGKGKFQQTAQSVQAQIRHQNHLEDLALEGGMGGYEYALAGPRPVRKFKQVANPFVSVRRNSGCGCGGYGCWDANCDCD